MKAEEYSTMEKAANKWLEETDVEQFSQMELLTMFAQSQLKEKDDEKSNLIELVYLLLKDESNELEEKQQLILNKLLRDHIATHIIDDDDIKELTSKTKT